MAVFKYMTATIKKNIPGGLGGDVVKSLPTTTEVVGSNSPSSSTFSGGKRSQT